MDRPYFKSNYKVLIETLPEIIGRFWDRCRPYFLLIGQLPASDAIHWIRYHLVGQGLRYLRNEYNYKFKVRWARLFCGSNASNFYIMTDGNLDPDWMNRKTGPSAGSITLNEVKKIDW